MTTNFRCSLNAEANDNNCICVYVQYAILSFCKVFNRVNAFFGSNMYLYSSANVFLCTAGRSPKEFSLFDSLKPTWSTLYYFLASHPQWSSLGFTVPLTLQPDILTSIYMIRIAQGFCHLRVGENRAVYKFSILGREFNTFGGHNFYCLSACLAYLVSGM